jgi:hypothetical protein
MTPTVPYTRRRRCHFVQPVKVVSSTGQKSEGQSFSLNNLVDTSFEVIAVRETGTLVLFVHGMGLS